MALVPCSYMRLVCPILDYVMIHSKLHKLIFYKFITTNVYSWCPTQFLSKHSLPILHNNYAILSPISSNFWPSHPLFLVFSYSHLTSSFSPVLHFSLKGWKPLRGPPPHLSTIVLTNSQQTLHPFFHCIEGRASIAIVSLCTKINQEILGVVNLS